MSSVFLRTAGLIGGAADLLSFVILLGLGFSIGSAHVVSFLIASVLYYGYSLPYRAALKGDAGWMVREIVKVIALGILLISLRGGVLFSITAFESIHPMVAFLPALGLTLILNTLYRKYILEVPSDNPASSYEFLLWSSIGFCIFIRLFYLGALELIPEEAYYWLYAQNLSPGYLDHPPMVGWLIALGVQSFGLNEFGVRFFGFVASIFTAGFVSLLYVRLFGRTGVVWTFALALALPYIFGGGFFISPDAPLAFFWAAALYFLHRALNGSGSGDWMAFGLSIGFGMLSKYSISLLGLPALALMVIVPEYRHWFKRPAPYVAAALAAVTFSPVLYWNMNHEWASFAFQSTRRFSSEPVFSLHQLILDMACLVTPAVLLATLSSTRISGIIPGDRKAKLNTLFSLLSFLLPVSVFVFYSLNHVPKLNWTGPSFLAVIPVISYGFYAWLYKQGEQGAFQRAVYKSFLPVFFSWFCIAGIALHYLGIGLPIIPYSVKMHRVIGWRSLTEAVLDLSNRVQAETGTKPVLIGMDKHNIGAELAFYATKRLGYEQANLVGSRNIIGDEALMFRFWSPPEIFAGKPMVLVSRDRKDIADERFVSVFESLGPIVELPLKTGWSNTKTYYYRIGYNYRGVQAEQAPPAEEVVAPVVIDPPSPPAEPLTPEQAPQFTPAPPELNRS